MTRQRRTEDSGKLKPLKGGAYFYWDRYRGNRHVIWQLARLPRPGPPIEEFAALCDVCRQAWGWTAILAKAVKMSKVMVKIGCPRCEKRGKGKKQKRLRKALAS